MKKVKIFTVCFSALTLYCTSVSAQIAYEPTWSPPDLMALNNIKFNPVVNNIIDNDRNEVRESNSAGPNPARPDQGMQVSAKYTPSVSRTRTNLQNFANKTRTVDPAGAAQMEQMFAAGDIIGLIGDAMERTGLARNNAGDAYALYWISAWQAANGDTSTKSNATYQAVAKQAALGLSTSPEFAAATDAQKQEMAEALMIQAVQIDATLQAHANNASMMKQIAQAVKQGAATSGLDLDKMELTEEGFATNKGRP